MNVNYFLPSFMLCSTMDIQPKNIMFNFAGTWKLGTKAPDNAMAYIPRSEHMHQNSNSMSGNRSR